MRFSNRLTKVCSTAFVFILFCAISTIATGQITNLDDVKSAIATGQTTNLDDVKSETIIASQIKTLDHVRNLGAWGTDATIGFIDIDASRKPASGKLLRDPTYSTLGDELSLIYRMSPPDPRQVALKKIEEAKAKLAADEDRSVVEPLLRAALAEYFIADMRHRVRELDDIKAKISESEAKLQKRLESQQESVDLQLKIMLREADGQGFFRPEDSSRARSGQTSRNSDTNDAPISTGTSPR